MSTTPSHIAGDAPAAKPKYSIGGHRIEQSCGHFYPAFNGNIEFKTLRECQAFILFEHMPMLRLFMAHDKDCLPMLAALCAAF